MCELLKEGGQYSLTRILSVISYLLFIIVTAYLVVTGKGWVNYADFAFVTAGSGTLLQACNKYLNSRYNTPRGEVGKKII